MFISEAVAQTASSAPAGGMDQMMQFLPLILIFVVFYFLLIRPQQQKVKQHKSMVNALRRGDRVITQGGFMGSIVKVVNENELLVEIGENVRVRMLKSAISEVLSKTEPQSAAKKDGADKGEPAKDGEGQEVVPVEAPVAESDSKPASLLGRLLGKK